MQVKDTAPAGPYHVRIITDDRGAVAERRREEDAVSKSAISELILHRSPVVMRDSATVQEACKIMHQHRVGAIIVVDEQKRPVGIFTGRDAVNRVLANGLDGKRTLLREVMTEKPDCVSPDWVTLDALRQMSDCGYRHLPVVQDGKIVGLVSRGDFRLMDQVRLDEETGYWERI